MGNKTSALEANSAPESPNAVPQKSACPILSESEAARVYNDLIKPAASDNSETLSDRNAMPVGLRNKPMEGQQKPLSRDRMTSTIPKGGTNDTWTYPSPQMFFNGGLQSLSMMQMCFCSFEEKGQGR